MNTKSKKEFGERLKMAREVNELKLEEVANILGLTKSTLSRYESGSRTPDPFMITKLASVYKVTTDYLLFGYFPDTARGQLMFDLDTGGTIETPFGDPEITHKLLIGQAQKTIHKKIELLSESTLKELLKLEATDLEGILQLFKNHSQLRRLLQNELTEEKIEKVLNVLEQ